MNERYFCFIFINVIIKCVVSSVKSQILTLLKKGLFDYFSLSSFVITRSQYTGCLVLYLALPLPGFLYHYLFP